MDNPQFFELFATLVELTEQDKLEWKETVSGNGYFVSLGNYTIQITAEESEHDDESDYRVTLLDSFGDAVDSFTDLQAAQGIVAPEERKKFFNGVEQTYNAARRIARGADKAMREVLLALRKKKTS